MIIVGTCRKKTSQLFINRELSWLEFNQRVLAEANDESNPLLERLKFLSIVSSNLDEFFEVRVAGLKQQKQFGQEETAPDAMNASEQLDAIANRVRRLVGDQYACWREKLAPQMESQGIRFFRYPDVGKKLLDYFASYFREEVYPVLTPLAIDPGHPFPKLLNKSLNVAVELEGEDGYSTFAVVQVPRILPRVLRIPDKPGRDSFIFIGNLIQHHVGELFHGLKVTGAHLFRVTRNSNLYLDEEEAENLLRAIEEELRRSNRGASVRLEVQSDCPQPVRERLLETFDLGEEDVYAVDGPINLMRLMAVIDEIDRPDLRFRGFSPAIHLAEQEEDFFQVIRDSDVLLHHPYESFKTVTDFIERAARDPKVLAIKQTLYRTSGDSPIIPALVRAAQDGKQVAAIVELKARFDEAANIKWARMLEEAGVSVVYGLLGLKTHCKATLVVRREPDGTRLYAHLGTGNYNPSTARLYTDVGLMTSHEKITNDVAELFNMLTGVPRFPGMSKLLVAPFNLHEEFLKRVKREARNAKAGKPSGIITKMNALVDQSMIEELYKASQAGVKIRLIVRGICCLLPGIKGVSENIEVRSIVGRFLEHSRIYRFENGGKEEVYIGSADWMPRNFFRRIEACVPILAPVLRDRVREIVEAHWRDNTKARSLRSDGTYEKVGANGAKPFSSQENFLVEIAEAAKNPFQ